MAWNNTTNSRLQIAWKSLNCILLSVTVYLNQYLAIFNSYFHIKKLFHHFHRNKCGKRLKNIHYKDKSHYQHIKNNQ